MSAAASLLVVSDTHGDIASFAHILGWAKKRCIGALAFLGDATVDIGPACDRAGFHPPVIAAVRGNGDAGSPYDCMYLLAFAGKRFLLTHGHLAGVGDGFGPLTAAARSVAADAALYGHTHVPFWEEIGGILVLNPGSPSRPRGGTEKSFATIGCPGDASWFTVEHWRLTPGGAIKPYDLFAPRD